MRLGVISDTHGRLPQRVFELFAGVQHILHAGDIGPLGLLADLEAIASVIAVWGNTDGFDIRQQLPEVAHVELGGRTVIVVHGHQVGSPSPAKLRTAHAAADLVVFGHSHRPVVERIDSCTFLNPGSAGAPRFGLQPSVAIVELLADEIRAEILPL
jgi:putative phosphoesterase